MPELGSFAERQPPAVRIAESLVNLGADARLVDPHVYPDVHPHITRVELTLEKIEAADVAVILTDHDAIDVDLLAAARHMLDCRNRMKNADDVEVL